MPTITDKTLVAWVSPANLTQRGGSVLTIDSQSGPFDGIVFGEIAPGKWMAGSEFFRRTRQDQAAVPAEAAGPGETVQIAAAYHGKEVSLYRNGQLLERHAIDAPIAFGPGSAVVFGLRHLEAQDKACFAGTIDEARLYDVALDADTLARLVPGKLSDPKPLAWWTFEGGAVRDRMGVFPPGVLHGDAKVEGGKLHLSGSGAYVVAAQAVERKRDPSEWPAYHVTALPEEGVCLPYDANGCIYWKGRYHLMYIYQDPARPNGGHCWGHMSSTNLVNWTVHPPALVPEKGDPDVGIFSGNAFVNKDGVPMLCWFGVEAGVCVATAEDDGLIRWRKHPKDPIIPMPKPGEPGHGVYTVWDPYLWLEGDTYYCLLGGNKLSNGKDTLYLCKSPDLVKWEALHPFYEHPDLTWTEDGEDCSCPDFFKLGDKRVLLCISHKVGARCYIGRYENERFYPESHVRMNWAGGMMFAPESFEANGRRIMFAWVTDPRVAPSERRSGSGVQSLPRILSLGPDGTLLIEPAREMDTLRRDHVSVPAFALADGGEVPLDSVQGDCMEIDAEIDPGSAAEVGFTVRCTPDGAERTEIRYDARAHKLIVDMSHSTLRDDVTYGQPPFTAAFIQRASENPSPRSQVEAPLDLKPGEPLKLRIYLDRPMIEVFANGRQCVTQQIFPSRKDALQVKAWARGGQAQVTRLDAWKMAAIRVLNRKNAVK